MLAVKKKHVDLANQRFKVTMKKGRAHSEVWVTIPTIAMPLWIEVCDAAGNEDYFFFAALQPGSQMIRREQITRRWNLHVKKRFGITADFYSLKHSSLDDIAKEEGVKAAQIAGGHITPVITMTYLTGEAAREHERRKSRTNTFS